jgi:hypothetical protein
MGGSVVGLLNHTKDSDQRADSSSNSQRTESFLVKQENPVVFLGKVDRMNEEYLNNPTRWESKRVAFDNEGTTYVTFSLFILIILD